MVYGLLFMVYSLGLHYRYTIVIYEEYDRYLLECGEAVGAEHLRPLVAVVPGGRGRESVCVSACVCERERECKHVCVRECVCMRERWRDSVRIAGVPGVGFGVWVKGSGGAENLHPLVAVVPVQGYLAHKNPPSRRTLQLAYAWGPMAIL